MEAPRKSGPRMESPLGSRRIRWACGLLAVVARLFIAVWPPAEVRAQLETLRSRDRLGVRFVRSENWHVTLSFLGEADPDAAIAALDDVTLPSARARLGPAVDVLSGRALVIPVSGLDALAAAVAAGAAELGAPPTRRRFRGHLTIARVKSHARMPAVLGALVNTEFAVDEVALVQSRLEPDGARYETLHAWPTARPLV